MNMDLKTLTKVSFLTISIISLGCNKQQKQFDSIKDTHLSTHVILFFHVVVVVQLPSLAWCFVTPWTAARQASLSLTISRSLYSQSPALQAILYSLSHQGSPKRGCCGCMGQESSLGFPCGWREFCHWSTHAPIFSQPYLIFWIDFFYVFVTEA